MEVRLAKGLAEHIQSASSSRVMQDLLVLLGTATICRSRFSVHSQIIKRVVSSHRYSEYLDLMSSLPFISRSDSYTPRAVAEQTGKQAFCKTWLFNGLTHAHRIGNINALLAASRGYLPPACVRRGMVRWKFSSDFVERMAKAFDWYLRECDSSPELQQLFSEIMQMVGSSLACLEPPDLEYQDVLDICGGDETKTEVNWDVLSEIRRLGRVQGKCRMDFGHRIYHGLTNVKKEIRRLFRLSGEPTVEVDMHATFPAIISAKLAPPGERERLIAMCQSGDFYRQMADLLNVPGVSHAEMKKLFQQEVVFTFRPWWSDIWQAFACEFPGTAGELARIRDGIDTVVGEHVRYNVNGRRYPTKTRWGQRRLSRILSRVESEIFLQRALVRLYKEEGIRAVPIHDCLMVAERHAEVAQRVIERAAAEVLGFVPVVKIGGRAVVPPLVSGQHRSRTG